MVEPLASWEEPARHPVRADSRARRLAARWLLPVAAPPIERGAILIDPNGLIEAVGPDAAVPRPYGVPSQDLGDAFLIPGLINTHTHLELTGFEGQVEDQEFSAWIQHLRQLKTTRDSSEYLHAARRGLADCYAAGVTLIADTGSSGAAIQVLSEAGGAGVAYQEAFGPDPAQVERSLAELQDNVHRSSRFATGRLRIGVSPHAPYTVSGPLFRAVARWARSEDLPLAVHLAESPAEVQFLVAGTGPFAQAWRARGIPLPISRGQTPVAWLSSHEVLSEWSLCIHAVQVGPADIQRLADAGAAVAHCPLSNRIHGHGAAPLAALLSAGIRVGLGTDSVASVGRLDLLAEARAARALADLSPVEALELCTLGGAHALGLASETGSLTVGKWGDCTVIRPPAATGAPAELVLATSPADVLATYVGGREVYRAL
ncbi:MAG TPA: amidohydrolase family protein [Gemmatimonadales bacterium]|nr:amidohydrolase family protein [Gemmatimonadales bacterium]